jgi:hypothetical protein
MDNKLNELEQALQQLFDSVNPHQDRAAFDIGVEFGKELQRQGRNDYECVVCKSLREETELSMRKNIAMGAISDLLVDLVRESVRDYLAENDAWHVGWRRWALEVDEFGPDTLEKFCVQIIEFDQVDEDIRDFICTFEVVGRLATAFQKYGFSQRFDITILNDARGDYMRICIFDDIGSLISDVECHMRKDADLISINALREFLEAIKNEVSPDRT